MFDFDWKGIHAIGGSKQKAFEELCCQLASSECPASLSFERKGDQDAGVECFATFSDGKEWGWQAKYFDKLASAQWAQIRKSVGTALAKHPRLVRYYVCVPVDLSDARIPGRRSERQRWEDHVKKWSMQAHGRGLEIDFKYWGNHELLQLLNQPKNRGRIWFWFGKESFDQEWFQRRLEEAIEAAGPRYTPELHVDLPIAGKFEAFGRTERFFEGLKALARPIRTVLSYRVFTVSQANPRQGVDPDGTGPETADSVQRATASVVDAVQQVLALVGALAPRPAGEVPLRSLATQVEMASERIRDLKQILIDLDNSVRERPAASRDERHSGDRKEASFSDLKASLDELERALSTLAEGADTGEAANSSLLLLTGNAGMGKTHLLCDIAKVRVKEHRPTVLLLGQQFLSDQTPWFQARVLLDLPQQVSAEEFVGVLEAAAQAAKCRALVVIDALNEGAGRKIWPAHLSAFLAHFDRSEWVSVVLSARTPYEELVVPDSVRRRALALFHEGFSLHEYDAARVFFSHYKIEMPSAPLLIPEFQNPLFLKVVCEGLSKSGQSRLPRGFKGISATFSLFFEAINQRLAKELDYDPKSQLVLQAIERLAAAFVSRQVRWLSRQETVDLLNDLLPAQGFERSLYRGLVREGVLLEQAVRDYVGTISEVVLIAYERLADQMVAKQLLDRSIEAGSGMIGADEHLSVLLESEEYIPESLLEALCVQFPERTGRELMELVPAVAKRWGFTKAFHQSIIWRAPHAISDSAVQMVDRLLTGGGRDVDETFEVLVTLATLPDHKLNALYLHERLIAQSMPERDARWSTYLHRAWGSRGAVDRLIEWAREVKPIENVDRQTVILAMIALAWMFTSSNRSLRDRATKALVSLLSERLSFVEQLLSRFALVDDPYVVERVFAAAYGCVMRSHDPQAVGQLAQKVYDQVFRSRQPPAHILLRDYARGVIERAAYLGCILDADLSLCRPPYLSTWPHMPSEDEIRSLTPNWGRGAHDSGDLEWSRNRIGSSVLEDDFARYIIGTNTGSTEWLSISLHAPAWQSHDERLAALVQTFNSAEQAAWKEYEDSYRMLHVVLWMTHHRPGMELSDASDHEQARSQFEHQRDDLLSALSRSLSADHAAELREMLASREDTPDVPRFDLRLVQRYILWRVFDLGWTTNRFGQFDRYAIGYQGRRHRGGERIGKKYQWIAYHEILAYLADHFQFRGSDGARTYQGPWQEHLRDLDPSCTLRHTLESSSTDDRVRGWWAPARYDAWQPECGDEDWLESMDGLPLVPELLSPTSLDKSSEWFNLRLHVSWTQPVAPDLDPYQVERRNSWYTLQGFFIRSVDTPAFMRWAEGVNFWGRWMPEPAELYRMFLGEHSWSAAAQYFAQGYYRNQNWFQPEQGCPVRLAVASLEYVKEASNFDHSVDEAYTLQLPSNEFMRLAGLRWTGSAAYYEDSRGRLAAFDPSADAPGPSALLARKEFLLPILEQERLSICWTLLGEKRVLSGYLRERHLPSLELSGAFVLGATGIEGFVKGMRKAHADSDVSERETIRFAPLQRPARMTARRKSKSRRWK